jgi:vesicle coat complex subunit
VIIAAAPELIVLNVIDCAYPLCLQESDATCRRNAFVTLCNIAQPIAVRYLLSVLDGLSGMDELMQMAVIELVRMEAKGEGSNRVSHQD